MKSRIVFWGLFLVYVKSTAILAERNNSPTLTQAQKALVACVESDDPLDGIDMDLIDVLVANDPFVSKQQYGHLWSPFAAIHCVKEFEHGLLHRIAKRRKHFSSWSPGGTNDESTSKLLSCQEDSDAGYHGNPFWNIKVLGSDLSKYLGFEKISDHELWAPDVNLLQHRINKLNDFLRAQKIDEIPISFYENQDKDYGELAYLKDFALKNRLPSGKSGYLLHHDRNFHWAILVNPSPWFKELKRALKYRIKFAELMATHYGSEGKRAAKILISKDAKDLDRIANATSELALAFGFDRDWTNETPNRWKYTFSTYRAHISWRASFNGKFEGMIKKSIRNDIAGWQADTTLMGWYEENTDDFLKRMRQEFPDFDDSFKIGPMDDVTYAKLSIDRLIELNHAAKTLMEKE